MKTVLITGANRGIGLEFARSFAAAGWRVWASCRQPEQASALLALATQDAGRVSVHRLDVTQAAQRTALQAVLGETPLDVLINNAGVIGSDAPFGATGEAAWLEVLKVNTLAPFKLLEDFTAHLTRATHPVVATLTSRMGSIDDNHSGGWVPYRTAKAALNMAMKSAAIDLAARGITVLLLHPGWVKTDMGGADAEISVQESVAGMRRVIERARSEDSGRFFSYDGSVIPW